MKPPAMRPQNALPTPKIVIPEAETRKVIAAGSLNALSDNDEKSAVENAPIRAKPATASM